MNSRERRSTEEQPLPLVTEGAGLRTHVRWSLFVWAIPGIISALQYSVLCPYTPSAEPSLLERAFLGSLLIWYGWAALTPLVLMMGRRFPLGANRFWEHLCLHGFFAGLVVLIHTGLIVLCSQWVLAARDWSPGSLAATYHEVLISRLLLEMTLYAAVLGVGRMQREGARSRERETRLAEVEQELTRAQLHALRAQLQPHFLFNTLNSIAVLARAGEGQAAAAMLADLGELLRRALAQGGEVQVSLREELEFSERYLGLEAVRFGPGRLQVRRCVEPGTLEAQVPGFLLQPLVENAVRHGATRREGGGGAVELRSWREGLRLFLEVRDNGPGLSTAAMSNAHHESIPAATAGHGIGLANVRERLRRLYPAGEHTLSCENVCAGDQREESGVCVRIELPFLTV